MWELFVCTSSAEIVLANSYISANKLKFPHEISKLMPLNDGLFYIILWQLGELCNRRHIRYAHWPYCRPRSVCIFLILFWIEIKYLACRVIPLVITFPAYNEVILRFSRWWELETAIVPPILKTLNITHNWAKLNKLVLEIPNCYWPFTAPPKVTN